MLILGFNSTHDASAAIVRDGEILLAVEEERFTRQKHHYGFPEHSVNACLAAAGCTFADLDHVAFYWDPYRGLFPFAWHVLRRLPKSLAYFERQPGIWGSFKKLPAFVREKYGFKGEFHFLDHHGNHIASAFWPSGYPSAAAMTIDGTGEWDTTVLARIHEGGRVERLHRVSYPHSIGKLWESTTQYLGFKANSGEGKVMGLAPYGRPKYVEQFREILRVTGPAKYRLDLSYFDYQYGRKRKYSDKFEKVFGPARVPESPMEERFEDVAHGLQKVSEEVILHLARTLHEETGETRLVLAGGVALNSVANGRLQLETPFSEIFIQPSAGDAGAALGSALRVWHEVLGNGDRGRHVMHHAYLGPEPDPAAIEKAARESGFPCEKVERPWEVAADLLAAGKILGWFQGRSEYGPRALGNRSILADPRRPEMKDVLNARVKHREGFRPFAPAVLEERATEYFVMPEGPAPWMLKVFDVRPEKRDVLPAITHVDGTARVQTVRRDQNARYYDLIRALGERTGVPVVLNTSFNIRGEPIVETPDQAVACFRGTEMDALILVDYVLRKA